jgi:hypothetical protein
MLATVAATGGARGRHVREGQGTKYNHPIVEKEGTALRNKVRTIMRKGAPVRRRKPRFSEGGTTVTGKVLPSIERESKTLRGGKPRPREGRREYEI